MNDDLTQEPRLAPLLKPKQKMTLIRPLLNTVVNLVTRGPGVFVADGSPGICVTEARKRKVRMLDPALRDGAIILRGHLAGIRTVLDCDVEREGVRRFNIGGTVSRFADVDNDGGTALIEWLRANLILHTLRPGQEIELIATGSDGKACPGDSTFRQRLLDALGDGVSVSRATIKQSRPRVSLLTDAMKQELKDELKREHPRPLYKIFTPEGASTWVLYGLKEDGDTLMCVANLGHGVSEYGPVSLEHLETIRGPLLNLPAELDKFFDGSRYTLEELVERETLAGI